MIFFDWHEEPIAKHHKRDDFDCGEPALNQYLREHAREHHEKSLAKTFLAIADSQPNSILGYYSLSPASVSYSRVPESARPGIGRYDVPVFRLGRLAVALAMQRQGLGGQLLMSAARRCQSATNEVGGVALLIDAKNEWVADWYASYSGHYLLDAPLSLLLPLKAIAKKLKESDKL